MLKGFFFVFFFVFLSSFSQFLIPLVVFKSFNVLFPSTNSQIPCNTQAEFPVLQSFLPRISIYVITVKVIHTFAGSISKLQCKAGRKQNSTGQDKAMLSTDYGRDSIRRERDAIFKVLKNGLWRCL